MEVDKSSSDLRKSITQRVNGEGIYVTYTLPTRHVINFFGGAMTTSMTSLITQLLEYWQKNEKYGKCLRASVGDE